LRARRLALTAVFVALWGPGTVWAGGYELVQQGAAAGGVGHAGAGRDGDPSAAWFVPAATADGGGFRLALGASLGGSTVVSASLPGVADSWEERTANPVSVPPYLYASYSHAWWSVGVTANLNFAGGVRWPDDWRGRFEILSTSPRYFRATAYFAGRIGPVRLSVGPHLDAGSLGISKATDHVAEEGSVQIALRGVGLGVDVSAHVTLSPHVQLGATYRSRTKIKLKGEADFDVPDAFGPRFPDGPASSEVTLPDRIVVGAWFRPKGAERLTILADVGATLWSVNDSLVIDFEDEASTDTTISNGWRDTMAIRGGVEIDVHERVRLRGGGYIDGLWGAPPPDETLSPSSPDSTRLGVTLGGRVEMADWLAIDAFYEHVELLRRESTSEDAPEASYRGFANLGGLSVSLSVP